ncbi:YggN family protein [Shewanella sp. AS16]|uniref:YggN family protein n=1 Tax=Shewanella sp. AS16 TaxID=2907625 RepID=UPI001F19B2C7|nr:YggN family protein [Shewanella sp. AS16]MCE9685243.1 YggN family protein [Shewanella sp. AS16]
MKMNKLMTGLVISTGLFALGGLAQAHEAQSHGVEVNSCKVALNYDLTVEPKKLTVSDKGVEQYRIELDRLYVEGKQVSLNAKQKAILTQYSTEVSAQVPEVIGLVNEAVSLASKAVTMALTPLLGEDSGDKFDKLVSGLKQRLDSIAYQDGERYYLGATDSSLDEAFGDEFEQEIEDLVQNSIGSLMMSLGSQLMSSDGVSFEQKMETFSAKMEAIGDDIETQVETQSSALEAKAEGLCNRFEQLLVLEGQLRQEIPELAPYVLAESEPQPLRE